VEELDQLSNDLQNLLAATGFAALFLNRDLRILHFTPKFGELFNVRATDCGRPISDLTQRLSYPDLRTDAESVLNLLVPVEREVQDDSRCWYQVRVLPYRSTDDHIEGVVITFVDISSRKRAEEALRVSEQRLSRMANVESVGVLVFDKSGTLVDCNDAYLHMSGFAREEVTARGLTWRMLTPGEYMETTEQQFQKLAETGHIGPYEKEYFRKDGTRNWLVFSGTALDDGTLIEYCLDISDRKRAEEQVVQGRRDLLAANEALLRANADLTYFSYAVSHDMQEPLRMVMSYTQLLARDYAGKLDAKAGKYIGFAVEGARRMEALLNDLREYWSVDAPNVKELAPIDSAAVLDQVVANLQTPIQAYNAVVTRNGLPTVLAEARPLTLLLENLVGNAIKYRKTDTPPRIRVSARREGPMLVFSVEDNGIGIASDQFEAIFAPFKRLHGNEYPGTGLGLAMCRKIVERYRGTIWVTSVEGSGTTVHFTLPAADHLIKVRES
jgi:two-component system CheB/CheR fusion protein